MEIDAWGTWFRGEERSTEELAYWKGRCDRGFSFYYLRRRRGFLPGTCSFLNLRNWFNSRDGWKRRCHVSRRLARCTWILALSLNPHRQKYNPGPAASLLLCEGQMSRRPKALRLLDFTLDALFNHINLSHSPRNCVRQPIPPSTIDPKLMESSLHTVWESASGNPFVPIVGKDSQLFVGFSLLTIGLLLSGLFGLSKCMCRGPRDLMLTIFQIVPSSTFPSLEFQLR